MLACVCAFLVYVFGFAMFACFVLCVLCLFVVCVFALVCVMFDCRFMVVCVFLRFEVFPLYGCCFIILFMFL